MGERHVTCHTRHNKKIVAAARNHAASLKHSVSIINGIALIIYIEEDRTWNVPCIFMKQGISLI